MLAERDLVRVMLYDRDPDTARYLASDLAETLFGGGYTTRISAVEQMSDLARCDVILLAAGERRDRFSDASAVKPLFEANLPLLREMAETFTGTSSIFVIASEPVDLLTAELARMLRLPFSRVLGVGGVLDAYRLRYLLSEAMQFNPDYIRSQVIGPHDHRVLPLWDYTSINGVPIRSIVEPELLARLEKTMEENTGVAVRPGSSSRYAPAIACVDLLDAILRDDRRILSATVLWETSPGASAVAMGVPCVIGRLGAERIIVPRLSGTAQTMIDEAARSYGEILKGAQA